MNEVFVKGNMQDGDGNPTGGVYTNIGLDIEWQNGVVQNNVPNGASIEDVIEAVLQRLMFFQNSKFVCRENALAITKLEEALHWLNARTTRRKREGTEGTYDV